MATDGKRLARFLFCVTGVWASFFIWGVLQERISTHMYMVDGKAQVFRSPFVIIFMQALFASLVSICVWLGPTLFSGRTVGGEMTMKSDKPAVEHNADAKAGSNHHHTHTHHHHHHHHTKSLLGSLCDWSKFTPATWRSLAFIGFTMTFGAPFGYAAVRAGMPYPIMITVKLGKMIPIVVISTVVYRIRYPMMKYIIAILITAGVVWFTFAGDSKGKGHATKESSSTATYAPVFGTVLVLINLFMDGFTSSSQDVVVKTTHAHGNPLQLLSNLSCVLWSTVAIVAFEFLPPNDYTSAELSAALHFFAQAPDALYELILMALLNAVGQVFIFQTITHFGSLTLTAITVTRKTGSVFLSIFLHGHSLGFDQFCAMGLVLAGVALETYDSIKGKKKHSKKE